MRTTITLGSTDEEGTSIKALIQKLNDLVPAHGEDATVTLSETCMESLFNIVIESEDK